MILDTPCILFAGGKSSRMGEDKALLPFSPFKTLTEFQYTRLQEIFKNVYISCKDKKKFDFEANFIEDLQNSEIYAPTSGFIAAFNRLKEDKIFVLSVDTPFVSHKEIEAIINQDEEDIDACVAKTKEGLQPLCGIYHRSLSTAFQKMQDRNSHKLGFLLKNSQTKYVYFDKSEPFFNINHPHEYQKALSLV